MSQQSQQQQQQQQILIPLTSHSTDGGKNRILLMDTHPNQFFLISGIDVYVMQVCFSYMDPDHIFLSVTDTNLRAEIHLSISLTDFFRAKLSGRASLTWISCT